MDLVLPGVRPPDFYNNKPIIKKNNRFSCFVLPWLLQTPLPSLDLDALMSSLVATRQNLRIPLPPLPPLLLLQSPMTSPAGRCRAERCQNDHLSSRRTATATATATSCRNSFAIDIFGCRCGCCSDSGSSSIMREIRKLI